MRIDRVRATGRAPPATARRRCRRGSARCASSPRLRRRRARRRSRRDAGTTRRRGRRGPTRTARRRGPRRSPGCRCPGGRRCRRSATRPKPDSAQALRRGGGVVEVARPAEERRPGMMAGRPHGGVGRPRARRDQIGGMHRGVDRGAGGIERALAHQRHRVHRVQAELGADRRRAAVLPVARREAGVGEQVADDVRLTRLG